MQPGIREVAEPITGDECPEVLRFGVDVASAGVLQRRPVSRMCEGRPFKAAALPEPDEGGGHQV